MMTDTFAENAKDSDAAVIARGLSEAQQKAHETARSERRPARTEAERHEAARLASAHLPPSPSRLVLSDADLSAMRAAFAARFDEDLPRTESLMAVLAIGYRMAVRAELEKQHG